MANIAQLIIEHIDIWTAADNQKKSGRGRVSGNAGSVYGVKKLRELILELAVRGKLVSQDSNDEPTSELLKRIQAEKAKLIVGSKFKKEKLLVPIGEDEKPFELPKGWEWVHLPDVTDYKVGKTPSTKSSVYWTNDSSGYNWVSIADLNHDGPVTETSKKVTQQALNEIFKADPVPTGTILMSFKLTLGKISILEVPAFHNEAIISIYPSQAIDKSYLFKVLPARAKEGDSKSAIKGNTLNSESIAALLLPLPPLAEQHRIVAKVDELMALCDQLEQQHSNAQEAHETLLSQLLATLIQSQNATEFNANWQRIYVYFDVLFTTDASIDALKQTLLQLAVMGKLVSQDPNDEPASELLKHIQAEKAKLIAEGKLKKEKPFVPINEDEKPYVTPIGWTWVRLNELLTKIGAGSTPLGGKQVYIKDGVPFLRSQNVWDDGLRLDDVAFITSDTHTRMSGTHVYSGDLLFNITGASIGRCAIVPEGFVTGNVSQHVTIIRLASNQILRFIHLVLISQHVQQTVMDVQVGVSREGLSIGKLGQFVIPIPPLGEQYRIVAKVDSLMALCDQLKTCMQQANQQQQAIADVLVAQAVQPTAEIINLADYRIATACYAIKKMQDKPYFGRTAAVKILYLAEAHLGLPLNFQPMREAAGPLDKWIYAFEKQGEHEGWFKVIETDIRNGKTKVEYQVKSAIAQKSVLIHKICSDAQLKEFDRLLGLLEVKTTEEAEIITTLFAAWNDFLIDGNTPQDDEIVKEVRENWHESKARFTPIKLKESLNWMRRNHLVPQGLQPRTVYQQQLIT